MNELEKRYKLINGLNEYCLSHDEKECNEGCRFAKDIDSSGLCFLTIVIKKLEEQIN